MKKDFYITERLIKKYREDSPSVLFKRNQNDNPKITSAFQWPILCKFFSPNDLLNIASPYEEEYEEFLTDKYNSFIKSLLNQDAYRLTEHNNIDNKNNPYKEPIL